MRGAAGRAIIDDHYRHRSSSGGIPGRDASAAGLPVGVIIGGITVNGGKQIGIIGAGGKTAIARPRTVINTGVISSDGRVGGWTTAGWTVEGVCNRWLGV